MSYVDLNFISGFIFNLPLYMWLLTSERAILRHRCERLYEYSLTFDFDQLACQSIPGT